MDSGMFQRRVVVLFLSISVIGLAPAPAQAAQHQNANLYANWDFSGASGFWNVDQHVYIGQKASYSYWAQLWSWTNSPQGGYVGIQTNGNRFDGSTGDTAIFSLWDATAATGPSCGRFGGEGEGYSCRLAYPIQTDRYYRLRVWRLDADSQGEWWGAWIRDEATEAETYIGSIRVARAYTLMAPPRNFSEYFGPQVSCDEVPVSVAYWTQPAANSKGDGRYEYGSNFASGTRAACTGGSVTAYDFGWTQGARIVQGGPRNSSDGSPPGGSPPPDDPEPVTPPRDVPTNLTTEKSPKFIEGKAKTEDECQPGRDVTLFRRRRGPDTVIGVDTTNSLGRWGVKTGRRRGTYYASVAAATATDAQTAGQLNCLPDESPDVRRR